MKIRAFLLNEVEGLHVVSEVLFLQEGKPAPAEPQPVAVGLTEDVAILALLSDWHEPRMEEHIDNCKRCQPGEYCIEARAIASIIREQLEAKREEQA